MDLNIDAIEIETDDISFGGMDFDLDIGAFDIENDEKDKKTQNRYVLPKIHRKVINAPVRHHHAQDLIADIGDAILKGETVHALLSGNFIFGEIFEALAVQKGVKFDEITISTLSISQENVDSWHNMMTADYIGKLNLVLSSFYWSHNRQNAPYIYKMLDIDNRFQLAVASTHTKVTLIRIGEQKIVSRGSANMRSSSCIEEVSFETNPELYDFHMAWHNELMEEFATIKKPITRKDMHQIVFGTKKEEKTWQAEAQAEKAAAAK